MSVSDNFNRADGGFGANWTTIAGTWAISSNQGTESGSGAPQPPVGTKWSGNSWNAQQTSAITWKVSNNYIGPAVRLSGTSQATLNGYVYLSHGSLQRYDNGANTAILNVGIPAVNDVLSVEVDATSGFNVKINGASQGTVSDATYASGSAGIAAYQNALTTFDDWLGTGEIVASSDTGEWAGCNVMPLNRYVTAVMYCSSVVFAMRTSPIWMPLQQAVVRARLVWASWCWPMRTLCQS